MVRTRRWLSMMRKNQCGTEFKLCWSQHKRSLALLCDISQGRTSRTPPAAVSKQPESESRLARCEDLWPQWFEFCNLSHTPTVTRTPECTVKCLILKCPNYRNFIPREIRFLSIFFFGSILGGCLQSPRPDARSLTHYVAQQLRLESVYLLLKKKIKRL